MLRATVISFCLLFAALHSLPASAQGAANVIGVERIPVTVTTSLLPGEYYTHVVVDAPDFDLPQDDNGGKQWGKAILAAFNLGNKTKSLIITLTLTYDGQSLPEIPLVAYSFDKERVTSFNKVSSFLSPGWRVDPGKQIFAKLNYRYSEKTSYDPTSALNSAAKLIPSTSIVTALSGNFMSGVVGITASVFTSAGTSAVAGGLQDNLYPYSDVVGARALKFTAKLPDGRVLGKVGLSLVVSPSLGMDLVNLTDVTAATLTTIPNSIDDLKIDQSGVETNLLEFAEGQKEYQAMLKERSDASVGTYCLRIHSLFRTSGLTPMDRAIVIHRSLVDAGFTPENNQWLLTCFPDKSERAVLTGALAANFTPSVVIPKFDPTAWPNPVKYAMGCWISGQSGPDCTKNAPNPLEILRAAMAPQVTLGAVELQTIDLGTLTSRSLDPDALLSLIKAKAEDFKCFKPGLILVAGGGAQAFNVVVGRQGDGKINSLGIQRVGAEFLRCHE